MWLRCADVRQRRTILPPPLRMITGVRDNLGTDRTVQNISMGRSGRCRGLTYDKRVARVLQAFTQSPGKSVRQCPRETGVPKISVNRILQHKTTNPSVPVMFHAMNDDADRQVKFCEWFLHMCDERQSFTDYIVCST
jgi:hypothetical protein